MRRDTSKCYPPVTQEPRFLDPTLPMALPRKEGTLLAVATDQQGLGCAPAK
jgi:hypothetical protein